jgi:hypothetical protein
VPLEVRVRWSDGSAAGGLRVAYAIEEGRPEWGRTSRRTEAATTDADGFLRVAGVPPGRVALSVPFDHGASTDAPIFVTVPGPRPIEVVVPRAGLSSVRVVDAAGEPVAGARVSVHSASGSATSLTTDARGLAYGRLPPRDEIVLLADAPAAGPGELRVAEGVPRQDLVLRLGDGVIEGRIERLDGRPVAGRVALERVLKWPQRTEVVAGWIGAVATDAEGRFRFERVSEGLHRVRVADEGLRLLDRAWDLRPGASGVVKRAIGLAEATALTPVARVEVEGEPGPADPSVRVEALPDGGGEAVRLFYESEARAHRAQPVTPGTWTVRATLRGYETAQARVRIAPEGPVERPHLVLRLAR